MDKAEKVYDELRKTPFSNYDVFYSQTDYQKLKLRKSKVTETKKSIDEGYGVRVIDAGKVGFSYSTDFSYDGIRRTIEKASSILKYSQQDNHLFLPDVSKVKDADLENIDESIKDVSFDEMKKYATDIEQIAYAFDDRVCNTEDIVVSCGVEKSFYISTKTSGLFKESTYFGGYADLIAASGNNQESGSYMQYDAFKSAIDVNAIAKHSAERAVRMLETVDFSASKKTLFLDPGVGVQFMSLLSSLFDAENVFKGKSLFKGKIGEKVASDVITIVDDGLLKGGLSSCRYDDEGFASQKTVVIENGELKSYLTDAKNASRMNIPKTGNGFRGYSSQPHISSTNLYFAAGTRHSSEILKGIKDGVYIFEVMGLHTANPVSGEFSLGTQGVIIKNGKMEKAVKNIVIAGNLIDFLNNVSEVSSDLEFHLYGGNMGASYMVVEDIMVGG